MFTLHTGWLGVVMGVSVALTGRVLVLINVSALFVAVLRVTPKTPTNSI